MAACHATRNVGRSWPYLRLLCTIRTAAHSLARAVCGCTDPRHLALVVVSTRHHGVIPTSDPTRVLFGRGWPTRLFSLRLWQGDWVPVRAWNLRRKAAAQWLRTTASIEGDSAPIALAQSRRS